MKLLDNIKARIGKQVINGRLKSVNRNACFLNIFEAKSIGILYDATDTYSFDTVKNFARQLSDRNIILNVLGYVDSKELSEQFLYRKGFDFFCRKQLNWYFRPVSPVTDKFLNEKFDILINLCLEDSYPIRFITALSPARFKAGKYSQDNQYLDFMIDIHKEDVLKSESGRISEAGDPVHDHSKNSERITDSKSQLSFLIDQLIHYLSIIKTN